MNRVENIVIGYGSESGHAQALGQRLSTQPFLNNRRVRLLPLNALTLAEINVANSILIILSSSFGDGEPPANAEEFLLQVQRASVLKGLRYAIFGLGDTAYPHFCGFTRQLDALLTEKQAQAVINRVDADVNYEDFFQRWQEAVQQVLAGNIDAGLQLHLQVVAYDEQRAFPATVVSREPLNQSEPRAWRIQLDITASGMTYRAGDTLYVLSENEEALLASFQNWYDRFDAAERLRHKELRLLSKSVLRDIARVSGSEALRQLLKTGQKSALEAYLYGADLLDVIQDFCTPATLPLERLDEILSPCLPRAYSIASHSNDPRVELCIREVTYTRSGRLRTGCATGGLLTQSQVRVFVRANPGFYLPPAKACPVIMIGTGTGIAPLVGLLREIAADDVARECVLLFGDKREAEDFLYRDTLQAMYEDGRLRHLLTAFSRDGEEKFYVQHAIARDKALLCPLLQRGAHVYLCGNKRNLESAVSEALMALFEPTDGETSLQQWQRLIAENRLHTELY